MTTFDYDYWPFTAASADGHLPREAEKIAFLETAHGKGHESFRFGINDYGARSSEREGCILERGRNRWEVRLAQGKQRRVLAFVNDFPSAGKAVTQWLDGSCAKEIVESLCECLVTPPGAKVSHVVTEDEPGATDRRTCNL